MTAADVDEVLAIERAVQPYPWTRGNFCDALKSGYLCCVTGTAGELRGYVVLMEAADEAELLNIGVASQHQREGLGGAMLSAMLEAVGAKKMRRVFLEVRASNAAAIGLYHRAGFLQVGVRRAYYHNMNGSEDAIVMACDTKNPAIRLTGESNG